MSEPSPGSSHLPDDDIDELWRSLRRHVSARVRPGDQADDVVQDAWLKLLSRPPQRRDRIRGWLRVVAERLALERLRRGRTRQRRERAAARPEVVEHPDGEEVERQGALLRLLEELRSPYREVVRLRYLEDLETADIAARLGRTESTVRSQLKRGLDLLRARLGVERGPSADERRRRVLVLLPFFDPSRHAPRALRRASVAACAVGLLGVLLVVWFRAPEGREQSLDAALAALPLGADADRAGLHDPSADAARGPSEARVAAGSPRVVPSEPPPPREASVLRGRVLQRHRGTPIVGARVRASDDADRPGEVVAVSDSDGRFVARLDALPAWLGAEHDEQAPTRRKLVDRAFVRSGVELVLDSVMSGTIRGRVLAGGSPVAGAEVALGPVTRTPQAKQRGALALLEMPAGVTVVRTDADGRFVAAKRDSGRVRVVVAHPLHGRRSFQVEDLEREQLLVLDGSVEAPSAAEPLAGSASLHGRLSERSVDGADLDVVVRGRALADALYAQADEGSRFSFEGLPAGRFEVFVEGGGAHGAWRAAEVELGEGEARDLGELFVPATGGLSVRRDGELPANGARPDHLAISGRGVDVLFTFVAGGRGVALDPEACAVDVARLWPGPYRVAWASRRIVDAIADVVIEPGARTELALPVRAGSRVVITVRYPRPLAWGEQVEFVLHSPTGVEVRSFGDTRDDAGGTSVSEWGVGDDVRRIDVRTTGGLSGGVDLGPATGKPRKVEIALRETSPDTGGPRPSAVGAGR